MNQFYHEVEMPRKMEVSESDMPQPQDQAQPQPQSQSQQVQMNTETTPVEEIHEPVEIPNETHNEEVRLEMENKTIGLEKKNNLVLQCGKDGLEFVTSIKNGIVRLLKSRPTSPVHELTVRAYSSKSGVTCLWEEGIATKNGGYGVAICDENGDACNPIYIPYDAEPNIPFHMLVSIDKGGYVGYAIRENNTEHAYAYRVDSITTKDKPILSLSLAAYWRNEIIVEDDVKKRINKVFNEYLEKKTGKRSVWTDDSEFMHRVASITFDTTGTGIAFCKKYTYGEFRSADFMDFVSDSTLSSIYREFTDPEELYKAADEVLTSVAEETDLRGGWHRITTAMQHNEQGTVTIYVAVLIEDRKTRSSRGNRFFYGTCVLKEGMELKSLVDGKPIPWESIPEKEVAGFSFVRRVI